MEILLQWLDELDDAVFAWFLAWETLRRRFLEVGLAAALALLACVLLVGALEWIPLLAGIAAASVGVALLGAALASVADRPEALPRRA